MTWTPYALMGLGLWAWWDASDQRTLSLTSSLRADLWVDKVYRKQLTPAGYSASPLWTPNANGMGRAGLVGEVNCGLATSFYTDVNGGAGGENTTVVVARTSQLANGGIAGRIVASVAGYLNDYEARCWLLMDDYDDLSNYRVALYSDVVVVQSVPLLPSRPAVITFQSRNVAGTAYASLRVNGAPSAQFAFSTVPDAGASVRVLNSQHNGPNEYLRGELHEVIMCNRALGLGDVVRTERYLAQKWGIPMNVGAPSFVGVGSDFAARVQANDSLKLRASTNARAIFSLG